MACKETYTFYVDSARRGTSFQFSPLYSYYIMLTMYQIKSVSVRSPETSDRKCIYFIYKVSWVGYKNNKQMPMVTVQNISKKNFNDNLISIYFLNLYFSKYKFLNLWYLIKKKKAVQTQMPEVGLSSLWSRDRIGSELIIVLNLKTKIKYKSMHSKNDSDRRY